jgi:hypothetical protein
MKFGFEVLFLKMSGEFYLRAKIQMKLQVIQMESTMKWKYNQDLQLLLANISYL